MPIVSVSLPDELIESMTAIQESQGYAGRSDIVRAAIRLLLSDSREKASLAGRVAAILVVTHDESNEEPKTLEQELGGMGEKILRDILAKETEAPKEAQRKEISPENYDFKLVGEEAS